MLTDEERDRIAETLTDEPFTGPDHPMWAEVESIVRAARAQELRDWADELDQPPYDLWDRAAIPRLRDRAETIENELG